MCWSSKTKPVLQIAEEDIKVQKVLKKDEDGYVSPIFSFYDWTPGIVVETELGHIHVGARSFAIRKGFHSCDEIHNEDGVWCTKTLNLFIEDLGEEVVNAIIPKGSQYYLNEYGEYVSNKLKLCVG